MSTNAPPPQTRNIGDLREALFDVIAGVRAGTVDVDTARTINELSQTIVASAKVEVEFIKTTGSTESTFIAPPANPALPLGITGTTVHRIR